MINIVSEKNICNGKIVSKKSMYDLLEEDNAKIYEVIRVIKRKPIFLKEHFDRMNKSIELTGLDEKMNYGEFKNHINILIGENDLENCNVRVSFYIKEKPIILMYFIESHYPSEEKFKEGIYVVTVKKHRKNPNVKQFESNFRDSIDKLLYEKNAFEAILVNDDDTISEGSKSNVFFVKGNTLITSLDSAVLLGVTRGKVIELCENNGIKVEKRNILYNELKSFDGAFITGTSNNVLPIKMLDDIKYNSSENKTVVRISELYLGEMAKEIVE